MIVLAVLATVCILWATVLVLLDASGLIVLVPFGIGIGAALVLMLDDVGLW